MGGPKEGHTESLPKHCSMRVPEEGDIESPQLLVQSE
jgi:hypothetical protein